MADTIGKTDAEGTVENVRIHLTDLDCECCSGRWFQLNPGGDEGEAVFIECCGCGTTLAYPADDYEGPGEES